MLIYRPLTRSQKISEIRYLYESTTGKKLNFKNPRTFNEKIQWLKVNYDDPKSKICADKYTAREFVSKTVGKKYLIPLIGLYDTVDEIDWIKLPNKFVIKVSDGYNQHLICTDKKNFNTTRAKELFNEWLKPTSRIYWRKGSYPGQYKASTPKIMVEKYIGDKAGKIKEYKFMYLSGRLAFVLAPTDRSLDNSDEVDLSYFDKFWHPIEVQKGGHKRPTSIVTKPNTLNEMLKISKKLANHFPVCRVDLYEVANEIKFGELTFTPDDGRASYSPETLDMKLGDMIKLPKRNNYNLLEWKPIEYKFKPLRSAVNEESVALNEEA